MVVKKIFEGVSDDEVHTSFLKFGRGEYKNKFLIDAKKQASKWAIKTGPEFANSLVKSCLKKVSGNVELTGIIVSTYDLRDEISFEVEKIKNFQGVRKHVIDATADASKVLELMNKHPRTFFGLSFKGDDFNLKIKKKAPTSGKPGKDSDNGPMADFCTLKTNDKEILSELFFDDEKLDFKEIKINHRIDVEDIVYPSNMEELSPKQVREQAKRKGTIYRKVIRDGIETNTTAKFVA